MFSVRLVFGGHGWDYLQNVEYMPIEDAVDLVAAVVSMTSLESLRLAIYFDYSLFEALGEQRKHSIAVALQALTSPQLNVRGCHYEQAATVLVCMELQNLTNLRHFEVCDVYELPVEQCTFLSAMNSCSTSMLL